MDSSQWLCVAVTFQIAKLPFSTGIQEDYTQGSAFLLHAEHDSLHTDTVLRSVGLWSINGDQVIPPSMLIPMTRIVEEACK